MAVPSALADAGLPPDLSHFAVGGVVAGDVGECLGRFPEGAGGHPELCCLRWHRGPEPECAGSRVRGDGRAGVAGLALVLHAGVIDGGDPEGVVLAICPYAAAATVSEPLTSPAGPLSPVPVRFTCGR